MYSLITKDRSWFKDGRLHRMRSLFPAVTYSDGFFEHWIHGELFCFDEKNELLYRDNSKANYRENKDRLKSLKNYIARDVPSVIYKNGSCEWHFFGQLYRYNAPAVVYANGDYEYWENGRRHGMTVVSGKQYWFENGEFVKCIV